jgi:hypothetical protein
MFLLPCKNNEYWSVATRLWCLAPRELTINCWLIYWCCRTVLSTLFHEAVDWFFAMGHSPYGWCIVYVILRCVIPVVLLIQHKLCIYFKCTFRQNTTNSMWGGITV